MSENNLTSWNACANAWFPLGLLEEGLFPVGCIVAHRNEYLLPSAL